MKYIALIITLLLPPLVSASNQADYDPDALIKYRQDIMHALMGHNNAIKAIINGKVPHRNQLAMHMAAMKDLFAQLDTFFPEGSDLGETEAKDAIWDNPEKFSDTIDRARKAFADFETALKQDNPATARKAVREFGKESCGNCHKLFKKKDDDEDDDHDHDHDHK